MTEEVLEILSANSFKATLAEAKYSPKDSSEDEPLKQIYENWLKDGNTFSPIGDVSIQPKLVRSAYRIKVTMQGLFFERIKPKTAELYKFKSGPMEEVLDEIDRFWGLEEDYKKLGLLYTRGLMLFGSPGAGKSSIINQLTEMITSRGDVVFFADNISHLSAGLKAFRSVEPDRKVVVIIEDADEHIRYDEHAFLQLLDGQDSTSGTVYLATTNYIDKFPVRMLRSGRFDKKIEVPQPPYEGRLVYLENKLKASGMETEAEIKRLAEETEGMSFGDLLELVTAVYALKEPVEKVMERLKKSVEIVKSAEEKEKALDEQKLLTSSSIVKANGQYDFESLAKAIDELPLDKS